MHGRPGRRARRGPWIAAALGVVLALTAGLVLTRDSDEPATVGVVARPPATEGIAAPAPTTSPPAAQITLAFTGDVHFAERVAPRLDDPATTFGEAAPALKAADLTMVNLETAITERGAPEPKEFHFRAPATAFEALRRAGVDVATMANNHAADYGAVGLADSLAAISSTRFPVVGIGATATQAYAPYYVSVKGHRVAVLAASQIRDHTLAAWTATDTTPGIASAYDDRLVASVQEARARAEIVVVYVHWGIEGKGCPSAEQRTLAARLAEAGADAVIGTHAHQLQGAGYLGRTYVAYGLGNYLWWRNSAFSDDTGVLRLTLRGRQVVGSVFAPARIDRRGVPVPVTGATADRITRKWADLVGCTGLAGTPA